MTSPPSNSKKTWLLTSATLLLPTVASAANVEGSQYPALKNVGDIRERLRAFDEETRKSGYNAEFVAETGEKWLAWGNWGNWNNWPNWGNWGNWPNWGNWGNY